jgi:meiotically up-regulated gene 157 (Mug157) protein
MKTTQAHVLLAGLIPSVAAQSCPDYSDYSKSRHEPFSSGKHALSSMRPAAACRTFNSSTVETLLANMTETISDPDLYRLFENTYPNTLDTTVRWRGHAADNPDEELAFVITGDIDAMWLRDSANQLQSYLPLLEPDAAPDDPTSIASLYRGVINLQARQILTAPFCNAFQPPPESGIPPAPNPAADTDTVHPPYPTDSVFECKYELDSLAAFLQLSASYYEATHDAAFFGSFSWLSALQTLLTTARSMTAGTYAEDGSVLPNPYTFTRQTTRATETLLNDGAGAPVRETGMVRSAFRPSDDATTYPFLVPANMLFARALTGAGLIVSELEADGKAPEGLAEEMAGFSADVRAAVTRYGVVHLPVLGGNGSEVETVYAYEVDGYGSAAVMDDANVPSLLAAPVFGYLANVDPVYQRTRKRLLTAEGNPYFMAGKVINAIGGPHAGPGMAWPMASVVRILTSEDDKEIEAVLRELVASTDGLGLMHESINSNDASKWTREWFSWANGLFGQMILDLRFRKPHILQKSFQ